MAGLAGLGAVAGAGGCVCHQGTQGRALRGLHGEVETTPIPSLRTQGLGPPWRRASDSEEGGGVVVRARPGQLLGDFGRLPKPL